jgi:hypothetical protein
MKERFRQQLQEKDDEVAKREQEIAEKMNELSRQEKTIEEKVSFQVTERLESERAHLVKMESERAKSAVAREMEKRDRDIQDMKDILASQDKKLEEAQQAQADLLKTRRELEDSKRELELTVQKRVSDELADVRNKALKEAEDSLSLKVTEKEQTIKSMQNTIDELKRKADQGSQQLQGEVQELQLEDLLRKKFIYDSIEPVAKGEHGGDVLQKVIQNGQQCGVILWESKRTKNWSNTWLPKLRGDQRDAKADIAVLETQALPADMKKFGLYEGVWITSPQDAEPVAFILRHALTEIANAKQVSEGVRTKTELIYEYLTGPMFRQRVEAIVEAFSTMKDDLDKERKAITKQWAKREQQISNVINATAGMYGDLQGIAGQSLQEIEGMSLLALEG